MLFTFLLIFLNKTQTLNSPYIVYVFIFGEGYIVYASLVLCSWLFGYKFAFIYGGVVLILNLIIIIVIKKTSR